MQSSSNESEQELTPIATNTSGIDRKTLDFMIDDNHNNNYMQEEEK